MFGIKKFLLGLKIVPKAVSTADTQGEFEVLSTDGKARYHNGISPSPIVTEDHTATLENKTLVVVDNTITTAASGNLVATELNAALAELDVAIGDVFADLGVHITDTIDAHDASAISNIPAGSIAATDVQAAINELDGDIQGHITDAVDAHDASAISSIPSGNLAATEVQAALNELQSDVDTRALDSALTAHLNDASDAHDASAISSIPSGNLAATEVQAALNELQSDIDTRATASALTAHESDTSTHGVAVAIVGTTDTQTLTNKTLTSPLITGADFRTPTRSDVKQDTKANLETYAATATNGQLVFATDEKLMYQVVDNNLVSVGGSSGSLDTIFQLLGDDVPDWSTGDNATFLGGGTISGTFAADTTTPLQGLSSYLYTQAAGSLNDYIAAPTQAVDLRFRGQEVTLFFPYLYNGSNNDIRVVFYDDTNNAEIPSSVYIQAATTTTIFKTNIVIPSTCTSIIVGFQVAVLNSGKIFEFDSVQLTSDTTVMADIANITDWTSYTPTGSWSTNTTYTGKWRRVGENMELNILVSTSGAPTSANLTVDLPSPYLIDTTKITSGSSLFAATLGDVAVNDSNGNIAGSGTVTFADTNSVFARVYLTSGTYATPTAITQAVPITFGATDAVSLVFTVPIVGWTASNPNILTAPDTFSTDTAPLVYAGSATYTLATLANAPVGTFITFTYAASGNARTQTTSAPTQTTADMNSNGLLLYPRAYNAASTFGNPVAFAIQIGKGMKGKTLDVYKSAAKVTAGGLDSVWAGNASSGAIIKDYNETTGILVVDAGFNWSTSTTAAFFSFSDASQQASGYLVINASKNPALTGLNINAVAARGVNTSGQTIGSAGTTVLYDATKTYDTHGALNAATGIFTTPETGYYSISAAFLFSSRVYAINNSVQFAIFKNGASFSLPAVTTAQTTTSVALAPSGADTLYLIKGDTISITAYNGAGNTTLSTSAGYNFFSIQKTNVG